MKTPITKNKAKITAVIFVVLLMASGMLTTMPITMVKGQRGEVVYPPGTVIQNSQPVGGISPLPSGVTPDITYDSIAHLGFRPAPVGVGQSLLVNMWLQPPIEVLRYLGKAFVVTITKPNGNKDVFGPLDSFAGDTSAWFEYVPDQVGTYQIKLDYLGTYYPPGNYTNWTDFGTATIYGKYMNWTLSATQGVYYKPDSDGPFNFTVQNEMSLSWPAAPLPTDYWTRPVNALNREWWPILGNYPATGIVSYPGDPYWPADTNAYPQSLYKFVPYVQGPNTAHVVWKEQTAIAGLIGGTLGQNGLTAYSGAPNIIYAGRCYNTIAKPGIGPAGVTYWQCKDLRTGQLIWERPLATGESAPNEILYVTRTGYEVAGAGSELQGMTVKLLYCGGQKLVAYDPLTGAVSWNISIAPLTNAVHYANAEDGPLYYSIQDLGAAAGANRYRLINWTTDYEQGLHGAQVNLRLGVISNVTWPFSSLGYVDYESNIALNSYDVDAPSTGVAMSMYLCGASLVDGRVLFNISTPQNGLGGNLGQRIADDGKYCTRLYDDHMQAWDLQTGKQAWVADISSWPWGVWSAYSTSSAYGLLIQPQYDGVVAYNWTNGNIEWEYHYPAQYPYDNQFGSEYPFFGGILIADGKVYVQNNEHSPTQPPSRGYSVHCINATTGKGIWNISGSGGMSGGPVAIADGYLVVGDGYDGFIYTYGKGKSATTVTAPQTGILQGQSILIQGTVLDQSPAQQSTPCVSAASMKTQMEYLHMQQPLDGITHNITMTGVPVMLTAVGSDGAAYKIGTSTTEAYHGTFGISWTPPKADTYTITADFAGDDSYGSSSGGTKLLVTSAAATTTPTPSSATIFTNTNDLIAYIIVGIIAVTISIAIVGAVLYRVVSRRQ